MSPSASHAREEIWSALLKNQLVLCKYGKVSMEDSDKMVYFEFRKVAKLLTEIMKEAAPEIEA